MDKKTPKIKGYYFSREDIKNVETYNNKVIKKRIKGHYKILSIFIDIGPYCNLRCPFCYTDSNDLERGKGLTLDEIKYIIDIAKKHGAKSVVFAGNSEPLLDENIWKILQYINKKKMVSVVFTNGTQITKKVAKRLFDLNCSLITKFNSMDASVQDEFVGVTGASKKIYKGLDNLIEAGFKSPRLAIQSLISKKNLNDLIEVFRYCRENKITPYIETYVVQGRGKNETVQKDFCVSKKKLRNFFEILRKNDKKSYGYNWKIEKGMRVVGYGVCNKSKVMIAIDCEGNVSKCVTSSSLLGNIKEKNLEDILNDFGRLKKIDKYGCKGCCSTRL